MIEIPNSFVAEVIDIVNRHDREAFLDAFTQDGYVDDWGRVFRGREAITGWSDREFIGSDGTLTVQSAVADGDTVTVVGDWRSTHANGPSKFEFVVTAGKIASMTISEG